MRPGWSDVGRTDPFAWQGEEPGVAFTFVEGQEVRGIINNVTKEAVYIELDGENKAVIYANDMADYVEGQKLRDYFYEGADFKGLVKQIVKDNKTSKPLYILSTKLYAAKDDIKVFEEIKEKIDKNNAASL